MPTTSTPRSAARMPNVFRRSDFAPSSPPTSNSVDWSERRGRRSTTIRNRNPCALSNTAMEGSRTQDALRNRTWLRCLRCAHLMALVLIATLLAGSHSQGESRGMPTGPSQDLERDPDPLDRIAADECSLSFPADDSEVRGIVE